MMVALWEVFVYWTITENMAEILSYWNQYILSSLCHLLLFNYLQASQIDYTI